MCRAPHWRTVRDTHNEHHNGARQPTLFGSELLTTSAPAAGKSTHQALPQARAVCPEGSSWRVQVGLANQSVPLYLSEVAPPKMRGGLNNLFQVCPGSLACPAHSPCMAHTLTLARSLFEVLVALQRNHPCTTRDATWHEALCVGCSWPRRQASWSRSWSTMVRTPLSHSLHMPLQN